MLPGAAGVRAGKTGVVSAEMVGMHPIQLSALLATVLLPLVLFVISRWERSRAFDPAMRRTLALALIGFEILNTFAKLTDETATAADVIPMQLCDWALVAVSVGLWFRSQTGFDLAYFWALAGTFQALLTPEIDFALPAWRLFGFFYSHALIVVGVFHLLLVEGMRPRPKSLGRLLLWSEVYLVAAILINTLTGANFGFLARRPTQATMLDNFSDTPWLYVAQINLTGLAFFVVLYLPWLIRDLRRASPVAAPGNL